MCVTPFPQTRPEVCSSLEFFVVLTQLWEPYRSQYNVIDNAFLGSTIGRRRTIRDLEGKTIPIPITSRRFRHRLRNWQVCRYCHSRWSQARRPSVKIERQIVLVTQGRSATTIWSRTLVRNYHTMSIECPGARWLCRIVTLKAAARYRWSGATTNAA